jgi:ParB/RepB/Spo0J family partition protein
MITAGQPLAISSITIDRENRQRRELTDIPDLAASIARYGLFHPIVVDREGNLVAGERRLTAVTSLGWSHIEVRYVDELEPEDLHMIELEENIKRKNLTWQEEATAVGKYHDLKQKQEPGWTKEATAQELNVSSSLISKKLDLAKEIEKGNEKIIAQPQMKTALNVLHRSKERERNSILSSLAGTNKDAPVVPLLNTDFNEWAQSYTGNKFNLIHCDFPYGINADGQKQGSNIDNYGGYADGKEVYFTLLKTLKTAMSNVVADSAHLIFWFSMDYYRITLSLLTEMGWKVNPFPLIWHKSDNTGLLPDPKRGPRRIYETAFFASRGDRLVVQAVSNVFSHPGKDKEIHMSEKPVPMLKHFFRMVCDANSVMLDPTAGSANSLKAAKSLNANYVLGLEKSEEFYKRSCEAWEK